jgi:hypothetical protein
MPRYQSSAWYQWPSPEVTIPFWALVYMPILVTISTVAFSPRGWAVARLYTGPLFSSIRAVFDAGTT